MQSSKWLAASLLAGASSIFAMPSAQAQNQTAAAEPGKIEQVVVTASRRASTVQKIPIAVTAVTGEDIQERGIVDFNTLATSVPGVSLKSSGPGQTEFEMRGLTSSGGNSPTVGFYLDDVPLTSPAAAQNGKVTIDPDLYDLSRVEVLRGPQGTLYGSGSMGGTIKLITNQPSLDGFEGSVQTIDSDTPNGGFNHAENGMLNIPITDTLALRVVASEGYTSGWIDRVVLDDFPLPTSPAGCPFPQGCVRGDVLASPVAADYKDANWEQLYGTRVSLLWQPIENLSITPMFFYQRIAQGAPNTFDSDPGTEAHYEAFNIAEPFSDRFWMWAVTAKYHTDWFDVINIVSDWNRQEVIQQDESENLQWAFGLPGYDVVPGGLAMSTPQGGVGAASIYEIDPSRQFSEEFRVSSSGETDFKWLAGIYYGRFTSDWNLFSYVPGMVTSGFYYSDDLIAQHQPTNIDQTAYFGEASYTFFDDWTATAGLRYYTYNASLDTIVSGIVSPNGSTMNQNFAGTGSDQGYNPKLNVSYEPNDDLTIYGTIAKGFRPGGANEPIPTAGALGSTCTANLHSYGLSSAPQSFDPDTLWSYELGEKARLFNDALTVNGAGYFESWTGVQQEVSLPCGFPFEINAGDANVYGGELEVNAALPGGFMVSANGTYTDAYLISNSLNGLLVAGERLQDVPPWTTNEQLRYSRPLDDTFTFTALLENQFVGTRRDTTFSVGNHLPVYDLVNMRAGFVTEQWTFDLFINNVFNKQAWLADNNSLSINLPTLNRVSTNQPRTVGVDLSYAFGP